MRAECISNTNFQGKLVIVNGFSNKPKQCMKKVQNNIRQLIEPKDYNLYIRQDFAKNEINIVAEFPFSSKTSQKELAVRVQENISVNSKASRYADTSASVINQFENKRREQVQLAWERKQKKQQKEDYKEMMISVALAPVFLTEVLLHEINPKLAKKFENLLQKIGI